jgi:pimeloyl-ACP methyl ester carboxylesterase
MTNWFFMRGLVRETGHWHGFLGDFKKAFPGVNAIGLDLPGNGSYFRERSPASIPALTESVRRDFLRQRGEKNFLFAISLGAMVGLDWMSRYPGDFSGAALGNTSVKGLSPFFHRLRPSAYPIILKILLNPDRHYRELKILEMTSNRPEVYELLTRDWAEIRQARPVSIANSLRQITAALRFQPTKEKPPGKILLLNGGGDKMVNPACSAALAKHWGVPLATHPAAGHDITLDQREWVLGQIKNHFF